MMKKTLIMLSLAASIAMCADEPKQPAKPAAPPAAQDEECANPDQKQMQEQQRRRYEIMVLLQAYRVTPEDQNALRDQLKSAIVGRLKADFEANKEQRKAQIERIEKRLAELKSLDGQSSDEQINKEFDRLVNAPINGIGPRGWIGDKAGKGGPDGDRGGDREQRGRDDRQGNFGGGNFDGQPSKHPVLNRILNRQQPPVQGDQPVPPQGDQGLPPPPAPAPAPAQ